MKEALFYTKLNNEEVLCNLCPHGCKIRPGKSGICLIRQNIDGTLYQTSYGEVTSINLDPIEKKPLHHFYPGSNILSIGTNGCNLSCSFCQNYTISRHITSRVKVTPQDLLESARENGSIGLAYTYNEPTIWYEFVIDCAEVFHLAGLKNVMVTNGFINKEPLRMLARFIDAANIDLKAFSEEKYKKLGGQLKPVMDTIEYMLSQRIHIEITHLAIKDYTTDLEEFGKMCEWIASLDKMIPFHISRYFPCYKLTLPPTDPEYLERLYHIAKKYLYHVYLGNIPFPNNSFCPACGYKLVSRRGYDVRVFIKDNTCPACKKTLYFTV